MSEIRDRAIKKLVSEYIRIKDKGEKSFSKRCMEYLKKRCNEDTSICEDILQDHKEWKKCYKYVYDEAAKFLNRKNGAVADETVFKWVEDYFRKDDKAEEEEKARKAAEAKARSKKLAEERKAAAVKSQNKDNGADTAGKEQSNTIPFRNTKKIEGQLDMFAFMGM